MFGTGILGLFVVVPISGIVSAIYLTVRLNSRR